MLFGRRLNGKGSAAGSKAKAMVSLGGARRRHLGPAIQGRATWDQSRAGSKIASDIGTEGGGGVPEAGAGRVPEAGAFASGSRPTLRQTRWQSTPRRCLAPESASKISIRHQATRVLPKPDASRARVEPRSPRLSAGSTPPPGREPSDAPTALRRPRGRARGYHDKSRHKADLSVLKTKPRAVSGTGLADRREADTRRPHHHRLFALLCDGALC